MAGLQHEKAVRRAYPPASSEEHWQSPYVDEDMDATGCDVISEKTAAAAAAVCLA